MNNHDPIIVTGVGAVSAWGWGRASLWDGLMSGRTRISACQWFDVSGHRTSIAAEVPLRAEGRGHPTQTRTDGFALAATEEALEMAGVELPLRRTGIYLGGSTAGMLRAEEYFGRLLGQRPGPPSASLVAGQPLDCTAATLARSLGICGPVESVSSACASGGLAIGLAVDAIRNGEIDVAVVGGADGLCQLTYSGFNSLRSVAETPTRPFRADRSGLSLGEGGAIMILERSSKDRPGRTALATVLGHGASCDAHHMTAPHPEGVGAAKAIEAALHDAGIQADQVTAVNAHGTGTLHNDRAESRALIRVFGPRSGSLPVTATKGSVGHILGSSGALEAVASILSIHTGQLPPTAGDGEVDPELGVDLVLGGARDLTDRSIILSTSFAFGGSNAAVLFGGAP